MQGVRGSSPLSPTTLPIPMTVTSQNVKLEIDGRSFEAPEGTTIGALLGSQYKEGFKQGIAATLNGKVVDFLTPIHESGRLTLLPIDSPEGLRVLRHSTAHLMASAVLKLFPNPKLPIRPAIDDAFYYAFPSKDLLQQHLARDEEAKKRDHRKLGQELDLYSEQEEARGGLIFWHPNGAAMRRVIEDFWKDEHLRRGYQLVNTPHIAQVDLWEKSGHTNFYRENMYFMEVDEKEYVLKPMNCPFHVLIFKRRKNSYRDLPVRIAELGTVYRLEKSGVLHGLARVRGFTQDDAHLFCTRDQVESELAQALDFARYMLQTFGFKEYQVDLSVRDAKRKQDYMGSDEDWALAEGALERVVQASGLPYHRAEGEAVFYGPKIDIKLTDAIGRPWQCGTIQFDFNQARRFDINYVGSDGQEHQVFMIHRALLGSLERFFATLIEHYGGDFSLLLAPPPARPLTS